MLKKLIEYTSSAAGFRQDMIEKDYYLTLILKDINSGLGENLIFKGGTCLNKIYYEYFRLSEDLDFTMKTPGANMNRKKRSLLMKGIKDNLEKYAALLGLNIDKSVKPGKNENRQYVFYLEYPSVISGSRGRIKLEIGIRGNPVLAPVKMEVKSIFNDPFTGKSIFGKGSILCLQLKEMAAEKFRAAATREIPAPRDFYDLYYYIKKGFDFSSSEVLKLIDIKLEEDGHGGRRKEYFQTFNKSKNEFEELESRVERELFPVLREKDKRDFSLKKVFDHFRSINDK